MTLIELIHVADEHGRDSPGDEHIVGSGEVDDRGADVDRGAADPVTGHRRRGSLLIRHGKGGRRRDLGMDQ